MLKLPILNLATELTILIQTRLVEVLPVDMMAGSTLVVPRIQAIFAECMADYQGYSFLARFRRGLELHAEGLIFKAVESEYNDYHFPWVKLKRDYIPGLGDCVDVVVIGASWDKDRGRDLRGLFVIHSVSSSELPTSKQLALALLRHSISDS